MSGIGSRAYYYVLDGHVPRATTWRESFGHAEVRRVASTDLGDISVSTVFLGFDHNWGDGPPILFETMVFGGDHGGYEWRYSTWDEAVDGHNRVVAAVKGDGEWPA